MLDRSIFLAEARRAPFNGRLQPGQEQGLRAILDAWERRMPNGDPRWLAYMLATAYHETAFTMQPIREFGRGRGRRYGTPDPQTSQTYYGRGYVQLTWKDNYAKATQLFGRDFVNQPDLALDSGLAAAIMFSGMSGGWFTGKKLGDYFSPGVEDWFNARRIVNGTDRADQIATYGRRFLAAIHAASQAMAHSGAGGTGPVSAGALFRGGPQGAAVLALQEALGQKGYPPGPLDGEFGPLTEQALLAFQKDSGLLPTGVFDAAQWPVLTAAAPRSLPVERVTANQQTLRELGSVTIGETDRSKRVAIGTGLLAALGLGDSQTQVLPTLATRLTDLFGGGAGASTGPAFVEPLARLALGVISPGSPGIWLGLAGAAAYLWRSANNVAERRVEDHRSGANIRDLHR
jgi:putative chitinase